MSFINDIVGTVLLLDYISSHFSSLEKQFCLKNQLKIHHRSFSNLFEPSIDMFKPNVYDCLTVDSHTIFTDTFPFPS